MDPTQDALVKLATELTDRVAELEKENTQLKQQAAQVKEASAQIPAPQVTAELVDKTCDALLKAGALTEEQLEQTKQAYLTDPDAAHRTIQGLLDALTHTKTASESSAANVTGGSLVSVKGATAAYEEDCLDKMARILRMN